MLCSLWFSWMHMLPSLLKVKWCNDFSTLNFWRAYIVLSLHFLQARWHFIKCLWWCLILFADRSLIQEKYPSWTRAWFIRRCLFQGQLGLSCFKWLGITPFFSEVCWKCHCSLVLKHYANISYSEIVHQPILFRPFNLSEPHVVLPLITCHLNDCSAFPVFLWSVDKFHSYLVLKPCTMIFNP